MLDRLPFHQEYDVFRDVRCEVRHALQIPAHEEELHRRSDRARVFHHMGQQDAEHRVAQRVHAVVLAADLAAELPVPTHEGVQRPRKHGARLARHFRELVLGRKQQPVPVEPLGGLRDVDRVVAHALEVVGDLHGGKEEPEIPRHRLLGREQVDDCLLDLELESVERAVSGDDLRGERIVARERSIHGYVQGLLGIGRHGEELCLKLRQFVVKVAADLGVPPRVPPKRVGLLVQPNLPVM